MWDLLAKRAGIPAGKIAVVTGQTNNEPDQILEVQDGFNAHGEDNKYQIILANEKAEVGINLQKGTQAIHHLTIGWTPDSLTQRNGRGVRQGNKTGVVNVYYYDAEGTFDTYRRGMVNKKADWIETVLDSEGGNSVNVAGGLSDKQYEALVNSLGDSDAMSKIQREIEAAEAAERAARTRSNQVINAETIIKNLRLAQKMGNPADFIKDKLVTLYGLRKDVEKLWARIESKGASESARAKNRARIDDIEASANGMERDIEAACSIEGGWPMKKVTVHELFQRVDGSYQKRGQTPADKLREALKSYAIDVVEGSDLHQDWQSEVDMAKSMAREAAENFARQSKEAGGYTAEVGKALAGGKGWVWGGRLFTVGSFVRIDGGLVLFHQVGKAIGYRPDGSSFSIGEHSLYQTEPVLPGTAEYDQCVTDAAAIEDEIAKSGRPGAPLSDVVPAVSERRKVKGNVAYEIREYRLPAPHFPFVIKDTETHNSAIKTEIHREQAAIVRSTSHGYPPAFLVEDGQPVVASPWTDEDLLAALIARASVGGQRLTAGDLGYGWTATVMRAVGERVEPAAFTAALRGNATEVRAAAAAVLRAALPWFDWQSADPLASLPYGPLRDALGRALHLASLNTDSQPAGGATPPPAAASVMADNDIVAITGNTRKWKDRIKAAAQSHGNGRFRWDGTALVWNVYRSAWSQLVANYPEAESELSLTKPTIFKF